MAAMRIVAALFLFALTMSLAHQALAADPAQAREVARINNCPPKKIAVYEQSLGAQGKTIYRVDCTMPKGSGGDAPTASSLLVSCDESLCEMLRPLPPDSK
jgi:hypothetical protein